MPKHILTKEIIIKTGIELIENDDELTFSTLSKQLGIRSQALYAYFKNVKALRYAIVAWSVQKATEKLQAQMFGQSGMTALTEFAQQLRVLALQHDQLSRFVISSARTSEYPDVVAAITKLRHLLHQLLAGTFQDAAIRTLANRCIRDLVVGDVVNVGTGWFTDDMMTPEESFNRLLESNLATCQRMDT